MEVTLSFTKCCTDSVVVTVGGAWVGHFSCIKCKWTWKTVRPCKPVHVRVSQSLIPEMHMIYTCSYLYVNNAKYTALWKIGIVHNQEAIPPLCLAACSWNVICGFARSLRIATCTTFPLESCDYCTYANKNSWSNLAQEINSENFIGIDLTQHKSALIGLLQFSATPEVTRSEQFICLQQNFQEKVLSQTNAEFSPECLVHERAEVYMQ